MTRVSIFLITLFLAVFSQKTNAQQTIKVNVENIYSDDGKVAIALFDKQNFLKKPIKGVFAKIKNGKSSTVFKNVPKGEFAIVCYHDANDNQQLDFSDRRIPLEDYRTSAKEENLYGPPIFEESKFKVDDKDLNMNIKF